MTSSHRAFFELALQGFITGTADQVEQRMAQVVTDTGADEILVTTNTYDLDERAASFSRLAGIARCTPERPQ